MRQFTKQKLQEGICDFSTIKNLSNVKNQFADYGAEMLGDVDRFQRIIQRTRKFGGGNGVIPEQFQTMKTFDHVAYNLKNEIFFHQKTFKYFFLAEFIPFLDGIISADGTFSPVKNTEGVYQLYVISTQIYDAAKTRTHLQPIMCILLPDKKASTYAKMWEEISEFYCEITGRNVLMPKRLHIDNEAAVLKSFRAKFPQTIIVTCLFHLKSNFKKILDTSGLKNRSPEVNALFKTITGILFLNLNCPLQFYLAENFISSIFNEILTIIPNDEEREKFVKFLNYFKKNYLNKKSVFFLGKVSNFQEELLGDWFPQLSNNVSESLNAVLQNCYKRGFVNNSASAEGLHTFYSDRRDKYRIFVTGERSISVKNRT